MKLSKVIRTLDKRLEYLVQKIEPERIGTGPNWLWQEANALNIAIETLREAQNTLKAMGRTTRLNYYHPGLEDIRVAVSQLSKHE